MEETNNLQEKLPNPIGVSGKPNIFPQITWQDFFALKQNLSNLLDFMILTEQKEIEKGNLKYFFETDLEEKKAFDKDGNPIKDEKGEQKTYKDLRDDFWQEKPKSLIITPDQMKITPEVN